jgi:hypothetical protein
MGDTDLAISVVAVRRRSCTVQCGTSFGTVPWLANAYRLPLICSSSMISIAKSAGGQCALCLSWCRYRIGSASASRGPVQTIARQQFRACADQSAAATTLPAANEPNGAYMPRCNYSKPESGSLAIGLLTRSRRTAFSGSRMTTSRIGRGLVHADQLVGALQIGARRRCFIATRRPLWHCLAVARSRAADTVIYLSLSIFSTRSFNRPSGWRTRYWQKNVLVPLGLTRRAKPDSVLSQ